MSKRQTWVIVLHVLALALTLLLMVDTAMVLGPPDLVFTLFFAACAIGASLICNITRYVVATRRR